MFVVSGGSPCFSVACCRVVFVRLDSSPVNSSTRKSAAVRRYFVCNNCCNRYVRSVTYREQTARAGLSPPNGSVSKLCAENFAEFGRLHDNAADGMYWTSERIRGAIDRWHIFGRYSDGRLVDALYALDEGILWEIFGIDNARERSAVAVTELISALAGEAQSAGARHIVYFCDDGEFDCVLKPLGFRRVGKYLYFVRRGE